MSACVACLRRTALLAALSPAVEARWRRNRPPGLLALDDARLVATLGRRGDDGPDPAPPPFDGAGPTVRDRAATVAAIADADLLARVDENERRHGVGATCRHDPAYPGRLLDLPDPPAVVHLRGSTRVLDPEGRRPMIAIVGARSASSDALVVARRLARHVAAAGATVLSGMAFGIDAAAHEGALAAGASSAGTPLTAGPTVAVLAGGIERAHPARLRGLYARIVESGAVVGELPVGATPRRWTFPARNRIIAALADVVVVVEAAERSGSLITASLAEDLGRPVAVVPGPVLDARAAGSNALLGVAHPILSGDDLLALVAEGSSDWVALRREPADPLLGLDGPLRATAARLVERPRQLEDLLTGGPDDRAVLVHLGELEARGRLEHRRDGALELAPWAG